MPKVNNPPPPEVEEQIKGLFISLVQKYGSTRALAQEYNLGLQVVADGYKKGRASTATLRLIRIKEGVSIDSLLEGKTLYTDLGTWVQPTMGPKERAMAAARMLGFPAGTVDRIRELPGNRYETAVQWMMALCHEQGLSQALGITPKGKPGRKMPHELEAAADKPRTIPPSKQPKAVAFRGKKLPTD